MKTSENLWFSGVFKGYRKRPVAWDGFNYGHNESQVGESYYVRCKESIWGRRSVLFVAPGFMMSVFIWKVYFKRLAWMYL